MGISPLVEKLKVLCIVYPKYSTLELKIGIEPRVFS